MKFNKKKIYETALHMAVQSSNPEIVQILLSHKSIDVNVKSIVLLINFLNEIPN